MKKVSFIIGLVIIILLVAGAVWVWQRNAKPDGVTPTLPTPVEPLEPTEPTEATTPQEPDSVQVPEGWKTYTNEEFAFRLAHPNNLRVTEGETSYISQIKGSYISFVLDGTPSIVLAIEIFEINPNETLAQAYSRITMLDLESFEKTKVTVAGLNADYFKGLPSEGGEFEGEEILLLRNNKMYGIIHYSYEDDEVFNKMLSTFRFLE